MPNSASAISVAVQAGAARMLFALPAPVRRALAGRPLRLDGQQLALDAQLLLRVQRLTGRELVGSPDPVRARALLEEAGRLLGGEVVEPVTVRALSVGAAAGAIPARLYIPAGLAKGSALLVFYHGGGHVIGSLDTHDNLCRLVAKQAEIRVLSVDYRLAPEHPYPAAVDDAYAALVYAAGHAAELGSDPGEIAVGGDSAGGNLAAAVSLRAVHRGGPRPAFQWLIYPNTDDVHQHRSREIFADGLFLTREGIEFFATHYCDPARRTEPERSPLLGDLHGLPPAYIATAGFDPLRDEGEAFADALREAGVPVAHRRHADLIHGYANMFPIGTRFREAVGEDISALRIGLGLRAKPIVADLFRPTT